LDALERRIHTIYLKSLEHGVRRVLYDGLQRVRTGDPLFPDFVKGIAHPSRVRIYTIFSSTKRQRLGAAILQKYKIVFLVDKARVAK